MKLLKIMSLSITLAIIVYSIYSWVSTRKTFLSPIPEEGIKIIQVSPTK